MSHQVLLVSITAVFLLGITVLASSYGAVRTVIGHTLARLIVWPIVLVASILYGLAWIARNALIIAAILVAAVYGSTDKDHESEDDF